MYGESEEQGSSVRDEQSVKFALAISLLRSKLLQKPNVSSDSDALRWKRKAKERKQEILRLTDEINQTEDVSHCDLFPQSASCKCYFFDRLGNLSPRTATDGLDSRFNDVLRRRFLRQVRFKERRRKKSGSARHRLLPDLSYEDEVDQLRASVDFLVELCESISSVDEVSVANWMHQAVDFILGSSKNLLPMSKNMEIIEGIVSSLITRLLRKMCSPTQGTALDHSYTSHQLYIQHLIRKLGNEHFIGQRAILSISQRIYVLGESLLFMDPFDVAFPQSHECMFTMIQLIEFLISDNLSIWSKSEGFETRLVEEWSESIFQARKVLELLESRNGLYILYMDRVTGELAKHVGQVPSLQKLKPEILDKLLF